MATSSKAWEDFNVHNAFNKTLQAGYTYKYHDSDDEDDEWSDENMVKPDHETSSEIYQLASGSNEVNAGERQDKVHAKIKSVLEYVIRKGNQSYTIITLRLLTT